MFRAANETTIPEDNILMLSVFLQAHESAQDAALKYQRAVSMFRAAKETITIAEEASMQGANKKRDFDSALQEMLNHATIKVGLQGSVTVVGRIKALLKIKQYYTCFLKKNLYTPNRANVTNLGFRVY